MSATENGFVTTSCTMASRPEARSRWSAKPVINKIVRSGKSRAADSASAMPSITGIWISVSSRSNLPASRLRISSASAPSSAVTVSWPSMAMARATSVRMEASSSAISTRGIDAWSFESEAVPASSNLAGGDIVLVEEAHIDITPLRWRRSEPRLEPGALAGLQHGLVQYRVPRIDLGAMGVADAEAQPRQLDRTARFADDRALDHQYGFAFHRFGADLHVLEHKTAHIDVQTDHFVERRGLRQQPHHLDAPDRQRQHQRAHGGAGGRKARE